MQDMIDDVQVGGTKSRNIPPLPVDVNGGKGRQLAEFRRWSKARWLGV